MPPEVTRGPAGEWTVAVAAAPVRALAAVAAAVEDWEAAWEPEAGGGRLALPVTAGVRHGYVRGALRAEETPEGSRLVFAVEETHLVPHTSSIVILATAGAGGLLTVLWPFFPGLIAAAPLGAVLALGGWFLVVSRLRNSGAEDFLADVAKRVADGAVE